MNKNTDALLATIPKQLGFEKFNEMQNLTIAEGAKGLSLMILSPTGSGKTVAFLAIVLKRLSRSVNGVTVLILVPSRELALQIESVFRSLKSSYKITCCYGGHSFSIEQQSLTEPPPLLIGTPGRILDHIKRKTIDLVKIDLVVLDEFDKLLQLGFQNEMEEILKVFSNKPQLLLTSATEVEEMPRVLNRTDIRILDFRSVDKTKLELNLVRTNRDTKVLTLINLLAQFQQEPTLVFCNHRESVEETGSFLKRKKIEHGIFHGGLEQIDREKNLIKFRSGACNLLITTDLAARGLDVPLIKHIVHLEAPEHENEFLHRNGRTARMHAEGSAYLMLAEGECMPSYLGTDLPELLVETNTLDFPPPMYQCLYISVGKKNKIGKGDILGFLTQACGLRGDDIGLISILDKSSFVAVKRDQVSKCFDQLNAPKIKKIRVKMELAS